MVRPRPAMKRKMVPVESNQTGIRLADRYLVEALIGTGDLCEVYRGQDTILLRKVAIKVVPPNHIALYKQALTATSTLTHSATIAVFDVIHADDQMYIIQEFIDANPLSEYLQGDGIPVARTLDLAIQMAKLVAYAHQHQVVIGDITPSSIYVGRPPVVRFSNVGLPPTETWVRQLELDWPGDTDQYHSAPPLSKTFDVRLLGYMMWQMLTTARASDVSKISGEGQTREYPRSVPQDVRDIVRRTAQASAEDSITAPEDLLDHLTRLLATLVPARRSVPEETPPALRALRAQTARRAGWSTYDTNEGLRQWSDSEQDTPPAYDDMTVPQTTRTGPWINEHAAAAFGPRLRLPSTHLPGNIIMPGRQAVTVRNAIRSGAKPAYGSELPTTRSGMNLSLTLVLLIGLGLFVLFFLVGLFLPYLLGHSG